MKLASIVTTAFLVAALGASSASATNMPTDGEDIVLFGLTLPEYVAGYPRGRLIDYESEHRGLGYSVGYGQGERRTTIYIYDNGLTIIAPELTSNTVKQQFAHNQSEVVGNVGANRYSSVSLITEFSLADDEKTPRFLCASYNVEQNGKKFDSFLCLTSWNDNFVKLRITLPRGADQTISIGQNLIASRKIVEAWIDILWPKEQRALADAARGQRFLGLLAIAKSARKRCGFAMSAQQELHMSAVGRSLQTRAHLTQEQVDAIDKRLDQRVATAGVTACDLKGRHAEVYKLVLEIMLAN